MPKYEVGVGVLTMQTESGETLQLQCLSCELSIIEMEIGNTDYVPAYNLTARGYSIDMPFMEQKSKDRTVPVRKKEAIRLLRFLEGRSKDNVS